MFKREGPIFLSFTRIRGEAAVTELREERRASVLRTRTMVTVMRLCSDYSHNSASVQSRLVIVIFRVKTRAWTELLS